MLSETAGLLSAMKDDLVNSNMTNEERAKRNAELRERMNRMKKDMNGSIGKIMNKMLGMMGQDPRDLLTEDQINKLLDATFDKFDKDGSGQLEKPEFRKAWAFLGLEGSVGGKIFLTWELRNFLLEKDKEKNLFTVKLL